MPELTITGVSRRTAIEEDGTVVEYQAVKFTTAKGIAGEVRMPVTATNDEVRAAVRAEAARLDDLLGPV